MRNALRYFEYKALSSVLYCAPLGVLFGFNHEAYISSPSASFSFFGYVIIMLGVLSFKNNFTEATKKNPVMTVSVVILAVSFIMQYLATQLLLISTVSLGGCVLSAAVEPVADVYFMSAFEMVGERKRLTSSKAISHKNAWRQAFGFKAKEEA
jgi:hypothetical protein